MVTTVVLLIAAWLVTVPAILALARLLGRLSTGALPAPAPLSEPVPAPVDNVVLLVPRPRNEVRSVAVVEEWRRAA